MSGQWRWPCCSNIFIFVSFFVHMMRCCVRLMKKKKQDKAIKISVTKNTLFHSRTGILCWQSISKLGNFFFKKEDMFWLFCNHFQRMKYFLEFMHIVVCLYPLLALFLTVLRIIFGGLKSTI